MLFEKKFGFTVYKLFNLKNFLYQNRTVYNDNMLAACVIPWCRLVSEEPNISYESQAEKKDEFIKFGKAGFVLICLCEGGGMG